jgi:hypothetical protein
MIIKEITLEDGAKKLLKTSRFLGIAVLACLLTILGSIACQKTEEGLVSGEESGLSVKEGIIEFEGTAKTTQGNYLYIPETQGFDIVVQGPLNSGDLSSLIDKEVRGEGVFSPDVPSILVANTIEVKDETGVWSNVFTKTEEVVLDDYLDLQARDGFQVIQDLAYNKNEDWEGLENVKIQGQLEETDGVYKIVVFDDKDQQVCNILVDSISDFAQYYLKKLSVFDRFWFYITVKDTVEWNVRRRSRDLFHADVLFAGLF